MSVMNNEDLDTTRDAVCLIGHIKSILIKEKADSVLTINLPKSELEDLRQLLDSTERVLQVIVRPGKDHA